MKKIFPILLILIGATLLIAAVVFWLDTTTNSEPPSFGVSLRDWMTAIFGLGASIKGWMDLFKKEKNASPTVQININEGVSQIVLTEKDLKIKLPAYPEAQLAEKEKSGGVPAVNQNIALPSEATTKSELEIKTVGAYVEFLNSQVSHINYPGVPNFPSGVTPILQDVYVDQKFYLPNLNRVSASHYYEMSNSSLWLKDTAGAGKSTFVKYVSSLICNNYLDQSTDKLPIKLHASELVDLKEPFSSELVNYVSRRYRLNQHVTTSLESHIAGGKTVLLIDALDEIKVDFQKSLTNAITNSEFFLKRNQIILTSRPLGHLDINMDYGQIMRFSDSDAYKLISNWQRILQNSGHLTQKSDDLLERFKNEYIGDVFKLGGIKADIVETPLFLTFLIFYLSSPTTTEEADPFTILASKTKLLSKIVEHVIPYWEGQKPDGRDLVTPFRNVEALQTLFFVGFIAKAIPNLSASDLLWALDQNEQILSMDKHQSREYINLWFKANVIGFDVSQVKFWHEEIKDFCAARHLINLYKLKIVDESDIRLRLAQPGWDSVGFYFYNTIRMEGGNSK